MLNKRDIAIKVLEVAKVDKDLSKGVTFTCHSPQEAENLSTSILHNYSYLPDGVTYGTYTVTLPQKSAQYIMQQSTKGKSLEETLEELKMQKGWCQYI